MGKYVLGENAAAKLREMFQSHGGLRAQTSASSCSISSGRPHPFEIHYAASANDGAGAFIIWLCGGDELVIGGKKIDLAKDFEPASPYPEGWYIIKDMPDDGGKVQLGITIAKEENAEGSSTASEAKETSAEFVFGDVDESEYDLVILVADVQKSEETGFITIKQNITSAIILSNVGSGDDINTQTTLAPFEFVVVNYVDETTGEAITEKSIKHCWFYFNGSEHILPEYFNIPDDGSVYLVCIGTFLEEDGIYDWEFSMDNSPGEITSSGKRVVNVKLYDFAGGKPVVDYRHSFLTLSVPLDYGEKRLIWDEIEIGKIIAPENIRFNSRNIEGGAGINVEKKDDDSVEASESGEKRKKYVISLNIEGGDGIIVKEEDDESGEASESGEKRKKVVISLAKPNYTGSRYILADVGYDMDHHRLWKKRIREEWKSGLLVSYTELATEYYAEAVEETF